MNPYCTERVLRKMSTVSVRRALVTGLCLLLLSPTTKLKADEPKTGGGECRGVGPGCGGTAGGCAAAAAVSGINSAVAAAACSSTECIQLRVRLQGVQSQYCKDLSAYRADDYYCHAGAQLEKDATAAINDRQQYQQLSNSGQQQGCATPPLSSDCGMGPRPNTCGSGTASGGKGGGSSGEDGGGGGGGGGGAGGGTGGGNPGGPQPPAPTHNNAVRLVFLLPFSGLVSPPKNYQKLAQPLLAQDQAAQELATARERLNNPLPAPDYDQIDFPQINPAPAPSGVDEPVQKAFAVADALHREAVYIDAFARDRNRYLGAKAANDRIVMAQLASAMVMLIDHALTAGQEASQREMELQAVLEPILNDMRTALQGKNISWDESVKKAAQKIKGRSLPPEITTELKNAQIPADRIVAFQRQLEAITPELVEADTNAVKNLSSSDAPYLTDLQRAAKFAFRSWNEAQPPAAQRVPNSVPSTPASTAANTKRSTGYTHSFWYCSLFGALGALVVVGFVIGLRSAKGNGGAKQQTLGA